MLMRSILLCGTASLLFLGLSSTAQAQDAPAPAAAPAAAPSEDGVTDIVVTAQRRRQSLQDVPVAVSAFSGDSLVTKQITTTLDLARLVPNMVGTNNVGIGSGNTYFLRALGNTESIATFDPPVGTYVDDIYVSRQNANNFSFFDVDRIEVLRGPQGTLFGRNTTGGAINVILKKPADHFGGSIEGSYGSYNSYSGKASVDIPVSDTLLTKFSAFTDKSDGFVHDRTTGETLNGRHSYGVRGAVRYMPSTDVTWDVSADYIRDNSVNVPSTEIDGKYYSNTGLSTTRAALAGVVAGDKANDTLKNVTNSFAVTSNLQIRTGGPNISIISGYRHLTQKYQVDIFDGAYPTGGFALANHGHFEQFSQEIKLDGKLLDNKIDYVAGVFYIHENNTTDFADVFTLPIGTTGVPLVLADRTLGNTTTAPAIYAQVDWHAVGGLTLTAGGRWTSERKGFDLRSNNNPLSISNFNTSDITALGVPQTKTTQLFTPHASIQYRFDPDLMIYASVTRGFRSGGWNARATSAEQFKEFGPEKEWSYEAGLRSELFDRHMRLNLTGFYSDVKGFQVPLGIVDSTGAINFLTQNGADLRAYGLEAEATVVPTRGLSLFANLGLLDAQYRNPQASIVAQQASCRAGVAASCNQGIVDPNGNLAPPQRAPHVTSSFGASYELRLGDAFTLTPTANASYESKKTIGTAGGPNDMIGSQWIVGAAVTLAPAEGPWSLSVTCSNCLNTVTKGSYFPPAFFFYNAPMIWTVRAAYKF